MGVRSKRVLFVILLILTISPRLLAQEDKVEFEYLTISEGLSSNTVRCIYKDSEGLLWFGTDKGLNKYNGRTIEKFNHTSGDSATLIDDKIICVFEDHQERLWIGSAFGLNWFDKKKNIVSSFRLPKEKSLERNELIGVIKDETNTFIISESDLYAFNYPNGYKKLFFKGKSKFFTNLSCYTYYNGNIYLGTWSGHLFKYSIKKNTMIEIPLFSINGFKSQPLYSLYADNGSLLLSLSGHGLYQTNLDELKFFKQVFAGSREGSNKVTSIQKDNLNNYLLATEYGFYQLDKNFNLLFPYTNSFNNTSINTNHCTFLYADNTNIIWIGTRYGGINKYDPNKIKFKSSFKSINSSVNEKDRAVKCFFQDTERNLWIGGDFGLKKFSKDEQLLNSWSLEDIYKSKNVIGGIASIEDAGNGTLWIGNWGGGLSNFIPKSGLNKPYNQFLKSNTQNGNCILNILKRGDLLFLFTFEGLAQFNTKTLAIEWFRHDKANSSTLSNNSVFSYCVDAKENIWIGTENGLNRFSPKSKKIVHYFHDPNNTNSIASNFIYSLLTDSNGNIWIGTSNGVSFFDYKANRFTQSILADVSNDKVYSIREDNQNSIWLSNGLGLLKFDLKKVETKYYNAHDGVRKALEYSFKGKDGKLFFGGMNGTTSFHPENIINNPVIPKIILSQFKLFNKVINNKTGDVLKEDISYTNKIDLNHNQSSFAFEFSSLNYTLPEKNKFKYRLKEFETDWTYASIKEQATYTNVPPGTYVFQVLGSNNDGIWNTEGTQISLTIHSPWYWNVWSQLVYSIIFLFTIFLFYRFLLYRQSLTHELELERLGRHQEEEKFQERFNFFTNVSHQIRTPLTLISGSVEQITDELKNNSVVLKRLETVNRNTLKLLNLVNQLINFKHFETDKSPQLSKVNIVETLKELQLNYSDIADNNKIELRLDTILDSLNVYIDKDKLDKILNNLIHNALKFTPQNGTVTIKLETSNNNLKIDVADTGIGIAKEDMPNLFRKFWRARQQREDIGGIGLAYTKDLVATMKGIISVESTIDKGTTFSIEFPEALIIPETEEQIIQFEADDEPAIENGKSKILIVEDNDEMRHFIRETLETKYSVDSEKDALAGLNALKRFTPDVIISDVMMAGMDGITFCKEIKSNFLTSHIPVILLSANVLEEKIISGYDSGADDYISKPFSNKILLKRVDNLIEIRKTLRKRYIKEMFPNLKDLTTSKPDEDFLKNAIKIVEENYEDSDFDAIKFSHEMAVSRTMLYTKLKSITDQSVNEFIRTIRLKKAAWLLTNSNKQITDIAFTVGFSNAAYFSKCFTDQFGVSPRKYAEQNRNG